MIVNAPRLGLGHQGSALPALAGIGDKVVEKSLKNGRNNARKFALVGGFMAVIGALLAWRVLVK